MSADLIGGTGGMVMGGDAVGNQLRRGSTGVDWGRVFGVFLQKRASTGGATPSRLAAVMERGGVGQAFLPALGDVRRQECPRHIGAAFGDNR